LWKEEKIKKEEAWGRWRAVCCLWLTRSWRDPPTRFKSVQPRGCLGFWTLDFQGGHKCAQTPVPHKPTWSRGADTTRGLPKQKPPAGYPQQCCNAVQPHGSARLAGDCQVQVAGSAFLNFLTPHSDGGSSSHKARRVSTNCSYLYKLLNLLQPPHAHATTRTRRGNFL
jgi:hypothetical protein